MAVHEYKCPCCSGALAFDSSVQKLKCPFCDTEFEVEAVKAYDEDLKNEGTDNLDWDTNAGTQWTVDEATGLRSYICQSCGGEIVGDENTAATDCPFCGNHAIIMQQFSGALKPDYVIPFKLDKEAAKAKYKQHLMGKFLLPKVFKDENHIDEIKGIYVPFWLFDSDADADIRFRATRTRAWSDSNYNYVQTSYYSVYRAGNIGFDHVPVDGSTRMADDLMESVEPWLLCRQIRRFRRGFHRQSQRAYQILHRGRVPRHRPGLRHRHPRVFLRPSARRQDQIRLLSRMAAQHHL